MHGKIGQRAVVPEPGGRHKNVIDRPRAKTIDAGECPEWGKAHRDEYGQHIASLMKEIIAFWSDKKQRVAF